MEREIFFFLAAHVCFVSPCNKNKRNVKVNNKLMWVDFVNEISIVKIIKTLLVKVFWK
jgi:hypothetical protein